MITEQEWKEVYEFMAGINKDYIQELQSNENVKVISSEEFAKKPEGKKRRGLEQRFENSFVDYVKSATENIKDFGIVQKPRYPVQAEKRLADVGFCIKGQIIAFYELKVLYTLNNVGQWKNKRVQGIIKDVLALGRVKKEFPECPCFMIIIDVGDRYLYKNLSNALDEAETGMTLKGEWHTPGIRTAMGIFEVVPKSEGKI